MTPSLVWVIYGSIEQPTGGYLYDYLIIEQLRRKGIVVRIEAIEPSDPDRVPKLLASLRPSNELTIVGDGLCAPELAEVFEHLSTARRVLLVHHFQSWELELDSNECRLTKVAEFRAVAASDFVVATSQTTARRILHEYPDCAAHVVEPGADRLEAPEWVASTKRVRLLGVGSAIPRKRWDRLLYCLDELSAEDLHVRLVGDPDRDPTYSDRLEQQIAASPYLRTHVQRLGTIDTDQLALELAHSDALILPSSLEGYGMVLTEALHAGVPVIVSQQAAIPSEIVRGGAAMIFQDEVELCSQLRQFVRDSRKRILARAAAQRVAKVLPRWADAGAQFYRLLTLA